MEGIAIVWAVLTVATMVLHIGWAAHRNYLKDWSKGDWAVAISLAIFAPVISWVGFYDSHDTTKSENANETEEN